MSKAAVSQFLSENALRPSARRISDGPEHREESVWIPFWRFRGVRFRALYRLTSESETWRKFDEKALKRFETMLQTATFDLRPDFAAKMEISDYDGYPTPTDANSANANAVDVHRVETPPFEVRKSLAWTLVLASIRDELRKMASVDLGENVIVRLEAVLRAKPEAVRLPAHVVHFTHGFETEEKGSIRYLRRKLIVCGTSGNVACDEIACSKKAMALGGVGMGVTTFFLSGMSDFSLLLGVVSAAMASHYAKILDVRTKEQQKIDSKDALNEERAFGFATERSNNNWLDETVQLARDDAEWSRWKRTDRDTWIADERKSWALSIWKNQAHRRRERYERRIEIEMQRMQKIEAERRAEQKRLKWGDDWDRASRKNASKVGMSTDSQSFYKILGLDEKRNEATIAEIKENYRRLAQRWHPDKKDGKMERFQLIQKAYLTLGNKQKRETYDRL